MCEYDDCGNLVSPKATQPQVETKMLSSCGCKQHGDGCQVHYDGPLCPMCEKVSAMECDHAKTRGARNYYKDEVDRLKKLETEIRTLQSRIFELEDDPPIKEPRRPDDMPARHGLERKWDYD